MKKGAIMAAFRDDMPLVAGIRITHALRYAREWPVNGLIGTFRQY